MRIRYGCNLCITSTAPVATLCRIDVHPDRRPDIVSERSFEGHVTTHDAFGNVLRRMTAPAGATLICLVGEIEDVGVLDERDAKALARPVQELPDDVLVYLTASRYCETDRMGKLAWKKFGGLEAGTSMVEAVCAFVHDRLAFDYQKASSTRSALEAYDLKVGVCRDFTHLAITLCRCLNIPARYVNGYMGDIGVPCDPNPMDFNAWFGAYLDGRWYIFDPRHNARRIGRIPIARGRDASDVPMIRTFGAHTLNSFEVTTEEIHP